MLFPLAWFMVPGLWFMVCTYDGTVMLKLQPSPPGCFNNYQHTIQFCSLPNQICKKENQHIKRRGNDKTLQSTFSIKSVLDFQFIYQYKAI